VQSAMTAATERDQIQTGFTPEALVGAVMEVVTERPFGAADETVWFGAVHGGPIRRPTLSQRKPLLAGHVVAVGGTPMKATSRPRESGPGVTHRPADSLRLRFESPLRPRPGRVVTALRHGAPSKGAT
jgi:hypothetical protein